MVKVCGACERELPESSYSDGQGSLRQSIRRCEECVTAGNQLVLMRKGRTRSEEDECTLCNLLLPIDLEQTAFQVCCMKKFCNGCFLAAAKRFRMDCPFCRAPDPEEDNQVLAMVQKRVDAGDPVAMWYLGDSYHNGKLGLEKDVTRAVELHERAAELGLKEAHFNLGCMYSVGTDVEKDTAKAFRHWETAALSGHAKARHNIGNGEHKAGNNDLALQHFVIAANLGHEKSLSAVKKMFMKGLATKDDYAEALRGYQSAIEEMRSPDRDQANALGLVKILAD